MGKLTTIQSGNRKASMLDLTVASCARMAALGLALSAPLFAQSATHFESKAQPAKTNQPAEPKAAMPAAKTATGIGTPSRYVGTSDLESHVASLSAVFSMRGRTTDPFGQIQDPEAKPIAKASATKKTGHAPQVQAIPLSDIVQRIKVTTIMPGEQKFLVGMRTFKLGDHIAIAFRGKNIDLQITSVKSHQIDFRNAATGETAALKMRLLPLGMTPGTKGINAPGMVPDRPNATIELDEVNP